jgi:hypothetical protein
MTIIPLQRIALNKNRCSILTSKEKGLCYCRANALLSGVCRCRARAELLSQ